jgi:hypothetical protein
MLSSAYKTRSQRLKTVTNFDITNIDSWWTSYSRYPTRPAAEESLTAVPMAATRLKFKPVYSFLIDTSFRQPFRPDILAALGQ